MNISTAITRALRKYPLEFAYLFGSCSRGDETADSDLDIAIMLPDGFSARQRFKMRLEMIAGLSSHLGRECDVIILNDTSSLVFLFRILSEGLLLYADRKSHRAEYECQVLSKYHDFSPFIHEYNARYVEKFS